MKKISVFIVITLLMFTSCDPTTKNKELVSRIYDEVWNSKNPSLIAELLDVNFKGNSPGLVIAGQINGHPEYKELYSIYATAFPDCQFTIEELLATGDRVVVGYTFSGTNNGVFRDSTATAFKISVRGISIFKVAGGKVLQEHMVWDTNALLEQLRPRTAETGPGPTGMPIWPPKIGEPLIP